MRSSTTAGFAGGIPFRRGKRRPSFGAIVVNGVVALFALYLLMPIVLLLIGSIEQSWTNTLLPAGFTWRWFAELAADPSLRRAFGVSFVVALACCALDTLAGVSLAYALHHRALRGCGVAARVVMLTPIGVPALTLGFGYIVVFGGDALPWLGTLPLMIAAHAVLTLPYLLQTLLSDLRHLDLAKLEACAATLGAPPLRQFSRSCCRTCGRAFFRARDGRGAIDRRVPGIEPDRRLSLPQFPRRAAAGVLRRVRHRLRGECRAAAARRTRDARVDPHRATTEVKP